MALRRAISSTLIQPPLRDASGISRCNPLQLPSGAAGVPSKGAKKRKTRMTNGRLPQAPARERNRTGRRALDWAARPTATEALVDALRVKVTGRVILPQDVAFDTFTASIAGGVFKSPMTPGSRYRSEFADSLTVSGTITFHERRDECPFSAELSLNPTRTLHRALDAARGRPLSSLPPLIFFTASETLAAGSSAFEVSPNPEPTLDGSDNILPTVGHMGGTIPGSRDAFQAEYLHLFETNLRALLLDAMTPLWMPAPTVIQPCRVQREDGVIIELDWHKVTVEHAEIYWERDTPDAPSVVRRMMDAGLALARSIRATAYSGEGTHSEVNQDSPGFPSLTIPLTGKRAVLLAVYAKTRRRVRIEVRYMKDLNVVVRACRSPTSRMTLVLERLKANAARRLPWPQLGRIAALSPDVGISSIADLVDRKSVV